MRKKYRLLKISIIVIFALIIFDLAGILYVIGPKNLEKLATSGITNVKLKILPSPAPPPAPEGGPAPLIVPVPIEVPVEIPVPSEIIEAEAPSIGIPSITIDAPASVDVPQTDITNITITVTKDVADAAILVQQLSEKPAAIVVSPPDYLYRYFSISAVNIISADIKSVIIKFKVKKLWIDEGNFDEDTVLLNRYDAGTQEWNPLPTEKINQDIAYVYYSAESPGLSIFAVTAKRKALPPLPAPSIEILKVFGIDFKAIIGIPQTTDITPSIEGKTNIGNALLSYELLTDGLLVTGTFWADSEGYWSLTMPRELSPGVYTLSVRAIDPFDSRRFADTSLQFEITPEIVVPPLIPIVPLPVPEVPIPLPERPPIEPLFKLTLAIPSKYKKIHSGENVLVQTRLSKFQGEEETPVLLKWLIKNSAGEVILEQDEEITVKARLSFVKTFMTSPEIAAGKYIVFAEIFRSPALITASDTFEIIEKPFIVKVIEAIPPIELVAAKRLVLLFVVLLFAFFVLAAMLGFEYIKTKTKQITEKDLMKYVNR